ncbi:hypothetical protein [Chryseobacterium pennipullorum]|uniref:Lipoprotein n=1 Tax=Chryseobacterium pennipullorum TaxID=2258963 RepID=A0A3D9B9S6_9FLAO|nr:hypothetical protein [Chryseobacterium pennipullorum]REC50343.1 hypothetical protein DRF67_02095 [Chryseobacterium pennipullorum]
MKTLFTSINIILLITTISCVNQNKNENNRNKLTITSKQQKIEKIEITEITRGSNHGIVLTSGFIKTTSNGDSTQAVLSPSEWKIISKQAEAIDLPKISNLESPTTGRYTDRALSATVIITSNGVTYTSSSFDAGHPPKELEALYNTIQKPKSTEKKIPQGK